jgi:RNA polymerase sigma-70 factor (ECF subfamily)
MAWGGRRAEVADEALVRCVYEEHGRAILAYATGLLGDRHAAEDIVQEALMRAWRNPEALTNGKGSVRGWLLTVTRNLVIDRLRVNTARPLTEADEPAREPAVGDHAEAVVDALLVTAALGHLSSEHRQVLVEVYFKGRSVAETAQALGIPPGTVKSRCYNALRALRGHLGPAGGPGEVTP